jgi:SAM-dependent methyltransferase
MNVEDPSAASGYTEWKRWTPDAFGRLGRGDAVHLSRELRDVEHDHPVHDVLEVGYGNGTFLAYCRSRGWSVTGTELLPELVETAKAAGYAAHAADELDVLPDASFDLIAGFDVFEHIAPEYSVEFLRTLAAKLRPGGAIMLRYPNADTWIGNPLQNGDITHVNTIGALKMEYYAEQAGLVLETVRAIRRRRFETSVIHGLHAYTAGVIVKAAAGVAKVLYFPDLRVVLSSSNVVSILRKPRG